MRNGIGKKWRLRLARAAAALFLFGSVCGIFGLLWHYLRQGEEVWGKSVSSETGEGSEQGRNVQAGMESGASKDQEVPRGSTNPSGRKREETESEGTEWEGTEWAETGRRIRVCILGNDYEGMYHQKLLITSSAAFTVEYGRQKDGKPEPGYSETGAAADAQSGTPKVHQNGDAFYIEAAEMKEGEVCIVTASAGAALSLPELVRAQKAPQYFGRLVLYREAEGILLVNELPLEKYLCSVVASEMPSDYPRQALMAQAVCARTYAYHCMEREKNTDSLMDLDDSTSFQVYNNQRPSSVSAAAVEKTEGEILSIDEALYYSTSCGTKGREDLGEEAAFLRFLEQEPAETEEYGSLWVRWSVNLTEAEILAHVQNEYGFEGTAVEELQVTKRSPDGQAQELLVKGQGASVTISGEYAIRKALAPEESAILLQNGQEFGSMTLLPSAWFCIMPPVSEEEKALTRFAIMGGGYGHGIGMSQCGAAAMAQDGADYREILKYYYGEREILHVED